MGCVMTQLDEATTLLKDESVEAAGNRASSEFIVQYTYFSRISSAPCLPLLQKKTRASCALLAEEGVEQS